MLDMNSVKEELSYAYFHAVVSHVKGSCSKCTRAQDNMGYDAIATFRKKFDGTRDLPHQIVMKVQLKATSAKFNGEYYSLSLSNTQYTNYKKNAILELENNSLFLLILLHLPPDEEYEKWLQFDSDQLILKNCMYWASMINTPEHEGGGVIRFLRRNVFTPSTLEALLSRFITEDEIVYEKQ